MKRIATCLWLSCILGIASAQLDPKRIMPGKQLGKMSVGNLIEDMKWLKKPDYGDTSSGHEWQTWEAKKPDPRNGNIINSLDVYSSPNDAGKYQIRLIRSTSPTFATKDKVKVGSSFSQVKDHFPKIQKIGEFESPQFSAKVVLFDDAADGIAFEFKLAKDGSVGRHEKCLSIWVHEAGMDLLKQYYAPIQYLTSKPSLKKAAKR